MKPRLYVETSIISYLAARQSKHPETKRRQETARRWWEQERHKYELVAADTVRVEVSRGDPQWAPRRLTVLQEVALLPLNNEILVLAKKLVAPGGIPKQAEVDGIHVAAASIYRCDFLLT